MVGGTSLAQSQLALATAFSQRPEFLARYPSTQSGAQFVDAVLANIQAATGANLTSQRAILLTHFSSGGRSLVLFHLANDYWNRCDRLPGMPPAPCVPEGFGPAVDNRPLIDAEYNRAFVGTQYFGYLRRDSDLPGFNFWLGVVNQAPPRDVNRQLGMVCAFVTSQEYQERFSPVSPRTNQECPQ